MNEPEHDRNPTEYAEEQEAFVEESGRRFVAARHFARCARRDDLREAKTPTSDKEPQAKKSQVVFKNGEQLAVFGGPPKSQDQDPELRVFKEWDAEAFMPPRKRSKYTHGTSMQRDSHSQSHSIRKGKFQGTEIGGCGNPATTQGIPASGTLTTTHEGISPLPNTSAMPTTSQTSDSQSSDQLSLPTFPTKILPPVDRNEIRQKANKYYTSQANQERPQPYAMGNFSKYTIFKDG